MGRLCGGTHEISGIKAPLFPVVGGWRVLGVGGWWVVVGKVGLVVGWVDVVGGWVGGRDGGGVRWDGWIGKVDGGGVGGEVGAGG